mmetsp:Transcript_105889/g.294662  ORF Transcript_105889/g.294662 Transcript_105889/m.294662 type:complete len:120 (+) Transcript_105889:83-442(+)
MGSRSSKLSPKTKTALEELFHKMDMDNSGDITLMEAVAFWGKNFAKVNATAFFSEVDADQNQTINIKEYLEFWEQVKKSGYKEKEILDEVEKMSNGGSWVDWKDGRSVAPTPAASRNKC